MSLGEDLAGAPELLPARFAPERLATADREIYLHIAAGDISDALLCLRERGARFITLFADRGHKPAGALLAIVAVEGELVVLHRAIAPGGKPSYSTLGESWPAADWAERELATSARRAASDTPLEHPPLTAPDASVLRRTLAGLDVFAIPYGPVRSGVFEAIQFQVETGGEDVSQIRTRTFFKRRGIEARFEGLGASVAAHVAERVAGIATCAYAEAFAGAVERALGVQPPPRAKLWRLIHCELERLACHLDVIAKEASTDALSVAHARFQIHKEVVQCLRGELCGSRFGRGVILPGGVRSDGDLEPMTLRERLKALERDLRRDQRLLLGTASMVDRLIGAGHLDATTICDHAGVGPLARGSNVMNDARVERPYGAYRSLAVRAILRKEGDSMARVQVRFGEMIESLRLTQAAAGRLQRVVGGLAAPLPKRGSGSACGWAEAPQGEIVVWVKLRGGLIEAVHIASPSLRNWALFDHAFPKDVLTDFAFIEHSFGLTPAGADR